MVTCIIRYRFDPAQKDKFQLYAQNWQEVMPRCGADHVGFYLPFEEAGPYAYGVYTVEDIKAQAQYRAQLLADPLGQENFRFAQQAGFLRQAECSFLEPLVQPQVQAALVKVPA